MILNSLTDYYNRKIQDPESDIAPDGWEAKEIPFLIVIDNGGNFISFHDTREIIGKRKKAKSFLVPQGIKRTVGINANLLWDTTAYIFGIENNANNANDKRLAEQRKSFIDRIERELGGVKEIEPLLKFLKDLPLDKIENDPLWEEIKESKPFLTFRYNTENEIICNLEDVKKQISNVKSDGDNKGTCLISGEYDQLAVLHPAIKGVVGAQSAGANILSFNLPAFRSYYKDQGMNAPCGERSVFAYTTALNYLLRKPEQRFIIGDSTTVFWSKRESQLENDLSLFFSEPPKDNPDKNTEKIKALLDSVKSGAYFSDDTTMEFYFLALSPNASRISIRSWYVGTIKEIIKNISDYFEELVIVKPPNEPLFYSIWKLLVNLAIQDKSENIPPNLAGDFLDSILKNRPFPQTLLQAVLRRISSDTEYRVKPVRAALIKAYLNRYYKFYPNPNHKEIAMSLDTSQTSVGYQLGRLFSALERIQESANPGINSTIRDRYYSTACSSPVSVFPTLMKLKNHHLAKLENYKTNHEILLGEIIDRISEFPAHLDLHEQGKFAIGYYHQRQDFFTKKENKNNSN